MIDLQYKDKRVVVTGCFSGMGAAAARELISQGAEVHGVDIKQPDYELASFTTVDLRSQDSIDQALKNFDQPLDALFNCAGLPQTFSAMDVMKVNFIGMRYWTEGMLPKIKNGGAIGIITSTAGMGYMLHAAEIGELLAKSSFDDATQWCESHPELVGDGYAFSKEVSTFWTTVMGMHTIKQGVRINCIAPGPTQTPMMSDFESASSAATIDIFTQPIGRRATPEEQALPLLFLNSSAASFINGHVLNVDGGFVGGVMSGQIDVMAAMANAG